MKYAVFFFAITLTSVFVACGDDDAPSDCDTQNITYTNTIKGIIEANGCTQSGCHPAALSAGNFSLATYQDVLNFSRLPRMIDALRWQNGAQEMPREPGTLMGSEMLPDCDIDKIEAWLDNGLPE